MGGVAKTAGMIRGGGRRVLSVALAMLFPGRCAGCGGWRRPESRHLPTADCLGATVLCAACQSAWRPVQSPLCPMCGRSFAGAAGSDHRCGDCLDTPRRFDAARAVGHYDGALRAMIHRFKYQHRVGLAKPLAAAMAQVATETWPESRYDAVVPVPLHPRRLRSRGYNQAELLSRRLAVILSTPLAPNALLRKRHTPPQSGLGAIDRARNLENAFVRGNWPGHPITRVLLVDDVYTTGATAEAASRALRAAGAESIHVLTVARTD